MAKTNYIWDPESDNVLMETDENGDTQAVYTHEPGLYGNLISQRRGDDTSYYHFDALGSTRALTDENGNVTDTYLNDAWGVEKEHTGTTVNPWRWVGEKGYYTDSETERVAVRDRVYKPIIAQWISLDLARFVDGLNRYLYVNNIPPAQIDPSGASTLAIATQLLPCTIGSVTTCECCTTKSTRVFGAGGGLHRPEFRDITPYRLSTGSCAAGWWPVRFSNCDTRTMTVGERPYVCCGTGRGNPEWKTLPLNIYNWRLAITEEQVRESVNEANTIWSQCCIRFTWSGTLTMTATPASFDYYMPVNSVARGSTRVPTSFVAAHPLMSRAYRTARQLSVSFVYGYKDGRWKFRELQGMAADLGTDVVTVKWGSNPPTMAHEIGHAFSLRHNNDSSGNLMYEHAYWFFRGRQKLSADECRKAHDYIDNNFDYTT